MSVPHRVKNSFVSVRYWNALEASSHVQHNPNILLVNLLGFGKNCFSNRISAFSKKNKKWQRNGFPEPGIRRQLQKIELRDEARPSMATPGPGETQIEPKIAPTSLGNSLMFIDFPHCFSNPMLLVRGCWGYMHACIHAITPTSYK